MLTHSITMGSRNIPGNIYNLAKCLSLYHSFVIRLIVLNGDWDIFTITFEGIYEVSWPAANIFILLLNIHLLSWMALMANKFDKTPEDTVTWSNNGLGNLACQFQFEKKIILNIEILFCYSKIHQITLNVPVVILLLDVEMCLAHSKKGGKKRHKIGQIWYRLHETDSAHVLVVWNDLSQPKDATLHSSSQKVPPHLLATNVSSKTTVSSNCCMFQPFSTKWHCNSTAICLPITEASSKLPVTWNKDTIVWTSSSTSLFLL